MKKVTNIKQLQSGDTVKIGLNPEYGEGKVESVYSDSFIAVFNGKDLFGDETGVRHISFKGREDVYKK